MINNFSRLPFLFNVIHGGSKRNYKGNSLKSIFLRLGEWFALYVIPKNIYFYDTEGKGENNKINIQ